MRPSGVGKLDRYFVPDLSPIDRPELPGLAPRWVFVAESPHLNEVEPSALPARRPLCGAAGKQWWGLLGELLEGQASPDVSLERLLRVCSRHGLAVINAVQYPLDPKIAASYPDADPVKNLGFAKATGGIGFKKLKSGSEVRAAIRDLRRRLTDPRLARAQVWSLGNDAEWFVGQALTREEGALRIGGKVPHPSAWWRQGGLFGRIARERLAALFAASGGRSGLVKPLFSNEP